MVSPYPGLKTKANDNTNPPPASISYMYAFAAVMSHSTLPLASLSLSHSHLLSILAPPSLPPTLLQRSPGSSEPTKAEKCGDEHAKRHQDWEHEAAVVSGVGVGCPGPRLDTVLGRCWGALLATLLPYLGVFLFILLLHYLPFLQAWVGLKLWYFCGWWHLESFESILSRTAKHTRFELE